MRKVTQSCHFLKVDEMGRVARNTDPAADYSSGAKHVLDVIHEILSRHRTLEQKWTTKKVKLHQRLALKLFKEDVKQVCISFVDHFFIQANNTTII